MPKFFLPPINSRWRLAEDWTVPDKVLRAYDNEEFAGNLIGYSIKLDKWPEYKEKTRSNSPGQYAYPDWIEDFRAWRDAAFNSADLVVPAGTVFSVNRYHASNSGKDQITCQFLASPRSSLHPKKKGGKMMGKGYFYFKLEQFNELPECDHVTGI